MSTEIWKALSAIEADIRNAQSSRQDAKAAQRDAEVNLERAKTAVTETTLRLRALDRIKEEKRAERLAQAVEAGVSVTELARVYSVGRGAIYRWFEKYGIERQGEDGGTEVKW